MSAQLAPRPARQAKPKPNLRALEAPKQRAATMPFVFVMAAILAIGMVGMVVLATALQDQAFAVQAKQHEANALANRVSQLESQVADARSIKNLAIAAQGLGMRPNPYAVPMRLSDGKVFGTPRPVLGNEVPETRYLSDAEAAAQIAAYNQTEADRIARLKAAAAAKKAAEAAKKAEAATNQTGTDQ
ncbi:hypothetical protein [Propionicimonas sp.]|uniref:hypothetical protein n=1 Tax=Propionicimonas sp. TaxID=1955623 RepID=UPI0018331E6B|nr:hypothetical protein [Propionicimonas sp.]MBU3977649.1 hypothetical protein [Actinomycetota bacterium]MBA3021573.1 hypothetical protein [Propionicimonas sp.]MBU3987123.1 hypothetical protein [Actinomycetota bacterium]MBU4008944.1 hypothetical protein [Actinomycetota bacterium]MBU4065906.1 hypothetical protein [Actinomycetota bacterium]